MTTVPSDIWGQYSFTVNAQYNGGNCENMRESFNSVLANHAQEMAAGFVTKSECEIVRAGIIETAKDIEALYQGVYGHFGANMSCSIKVIASPCVSRSGIGAAGDVDIFASGQGGAMFFQNPAVEVSNWAKENERLMSIIGGITDAASFNPRITGDDDFDRTLVLNLDKPFESVNMREGGFSTTSSSDLSMRNKVFEAPDYSKMANMDNVRRYLSFSSNLAIRYINNPAPDLLTTWFHEEFKRVSGFDVDAIMRKLPSERTDEEKQALIDYQMYRKELADKMIDEIGELRQSLARTEETRNYEMAVLAEDCYGDSEHKFINGTNYSRLLFTDLPEGSPMRDWAELIDRCNQYDKGFNAVLYKNEVTGEYTLAFEGSNFHPIDNTADFIADWILTNKVQGLDGIPEQYVLAMMIAGSMPQGVSINFTGHSLGGGLASVAGVVTGAPTYTYNAEGVNNNILNTFGIQGKVEAGDYDIKAYQADNDLLTSSQEGVLKNVVIAAALVIDPIETIAAGGNALSPAIGDKETVESGGWHSIEPMVNYFGKSYNHMQSTYRVWQNSIHNAGYGHELQTQETIMIYTGE